MSSFFFFFLLALSLCFRVFSLRDNHFVFGCGIRIYEFLSKYDNYTVQGETHMLGGFGFVSISSP